jgi:hypothetical protein
LKREKSNEMSEKYEKALDSSDKKRGFSGDCESVPAFSRDGKVYGKPGCLRGK